MLYASSDDNLIDLQQKKTTITTASLVFEFFDSIVYITYTNNRLIN